MLIKAKIAAAALAATTAVAGGTTAAVHIHNQHGKCESAAAHAGHLAKDSPDHGKAAREAARASCVQSHGQLNSTPNTTTGAATTSPKQGNGKP